MITPQLATQEVPLGSPPPLPRARDLKERLQDRWSRLAVVVRAELRRHQRRRLQGNVADAMADKASSLLRCGLNLSIDAVLLVDQRPYAQRAA
jgi:hypothetical protein